MALITCPRCGGKYAEHFTECVHCKAKRPTLPAQAPLVPVSPEYQMPAVQPKPAVADAMPHPSPQTVWAEPHEDAPREVPKLACPCCGGLPGNGKIRLETRENKGAAPGLRLGTRYMVRWVNVPGVCSSCMSSLEIKRYIADLLCLAPLIGAFGAMVVFDSKAFLWVFLIYALYLLKWAWGLGYVWSDVIVYGAQLEDKLARYAPPGDRGTIRFPANLWHCLVRIGIAPLALLVGGVVMFGIYTGQLQPKENQAQSPPPAPAPPPAVVPNVPESKDPKAQARAKSEREIAAARAFLKDARDIAVPVDPQTRVMKKMDVRRDDMNFFTVYADPVKLPPATDYQLLTGPELIAKFLKTEGHDVDMLTIQGPNLSLSRWQAVKIAMSMPADEPADAKVLHSP